jgi:hypothetical protein
VHFNSGNPDFPFEPIQGAFIQQGCAAKFSAAKLNTQNGGGTIIWLTADESGNGQVVKSVGYQAQRISITRLSLPFKATRASTMPLPTPTSKKGIPSTC